MKVSHQQRLALFLALLLFLPATYRWVELSLFQMPIPIDLDLETPNLWTIQTIQEGGDIYGQYRELPQNLTLYTPLYHYLVALLPWRESNPFFWGRLVSFLCVLLAGLSLFTLKDRKVEVPLVFAALGAFFLYRPISAYSAYLRQDTLALVFSGVAILVAYKWPREKYRSVVVGTLVFLAFVSKQSFITPMVVAFFFFWGQSRRELLHYLLAVGGLMVAFLVGASLYWGASFWFSTVQAPKNPMAWKPFAVLWGRHLTSPLLVITLVFSLATAIWAVKKEGREVFQNSPFFIYLLVAYLVLFFTSFKIGSFDYYFFEPLLASLYWFIYFSRRFFPTKEATSFVLVTVILLGMGGAWELTQVSPEAYTRITPAKKKMMEIFIREMKGEMARLAPPSPRMLNLHQSRFYYSLNCPVYLNDSVLYQVLWNSGKIKIDPLTRAFEKHYFHLVILHQEQKGQVRKQYPQFDQLITHLEKHYQLAGRLHFYLFYIPKK